MHRYCLTVLITLLSTLPLAAQDTTSSGPTLCQGNYHSEADAVTQLARMASTYANLEQWRDRATAIRNQILPGAKLMP
ncbi:MAG: hypothetical protein L7W43_16815, partial [Rubripirellula sp.]|nr:hypothetical protein [Rubripirellula sp.]